MSQLRNILGLAAVLVIVVVVVNLFPVGAQARNPLVGTWSLVSTMQTLADGTVRADPQVGQTPKGYMIYSDANRMCAQFTNPARPQWANPSQPTLEEARSVVDSMGAYCGRYEVNMAEGYVLHHVEIDRVPNFSTQVRRRNFRMEGPDRLILTPVPPPEGFRAVTITWQRITE